LKKLHFPDPFRHKHPPIKDTNKLFYGQLTSGQQTADRFAKMMGSWTFIITQSIFLGIWAILNIVAWIQHWDPYPFILMNLVLSIQAAYAAPVIMMSQNRQTERDRLEAHNDYQVNKKAEEEVRAILNHNAAQDDALKIIYESIRNVQADMTVVLRQVQKQGD